jgi:hypothetical protein
MAIVTDKQFYMDDYIIDSLDFCAKRERLKWDNQLILDGKTGSGKSTFAFQMAYYYAWKNNKRFSVDNVFFDSTDMIKYVQNNKNKIIIWDEAALDGMSVDWQNENQQNLVKISMTARKLGHFIIFIIPEFRKLQRYFAVEKSIALFRVYSPDGLTRGHWKLYGENTKSKLYEIEKRYNDQSNIFPNLYGNFRNTENLNLIDMDSYESKKDAAIASIGNKTKQAEFKVSQIPIESFNKMKEKGMTDADIAYCFNVTRTHITHLRNKVSG